MKSERLKKLESELNDLEQWMKLGLVPKKEISRHAEEIANLKARISEEKERLQFLKESGEAEEFVAPKRNPSKTVYPETPSVSDIEFGETTEAGLDIDLDTIDTQSDEEEKEVVSTAVDAEQVEEEDDEDPFSDRNRWGRGGIVDPDATEW